MVGGQMRTLTEDLADYVSVLLFFKIIFIRPCLITKYTVVKRTIVPTPATSGINQIDSLIYIPLYVIKPKMTRKCG